MVAQLMAAGGLIIVVINTNHMIIDTIMIMHFAFLSPLLLLLSIRRWHR